MVNSWAPWGAERVGRRAARNCSIFCFEAGIIAGFW